MHADAAGLPFESLDFVYIPTTDVDQAIDFYRDALGGELLFLVRAMETTVAAVRISDDGPSILLAGHLEGTMPILVYRVGDYSTAVAHLRAQGVIDIHEVEIPHGPCAVFTAEGGQRLGL